MTIDEVKQLLELGRSYGLRSLSVGSDGNLYVEFPEKSTTDSTPPYTADFAKQPIAGPNTPTEDDLLFWSSPHTPDFQSKPPSEND